VPVSTITHSFAVPFLLAFHPTHTFFKIFFFSTYLSYLASQWTPVNRNQDRDIIVNAFKVFDPTNTGSVSSADFQQVMGSLGDSLTAEELNNMAAASDDGSGRINYNSFADVLISN